MKRHIIGGLAAAATIVASMSVLSSGVAPAAGAPAAGKAEARQAARAMITSRAPELRISRHDAFSGGKVWSGGAGYKYVAYERTYKGLPVLGGDFVVATDADGAVVSTSVAQTRTLRVRSLKPTVSRAEARQEAKRGFTDLRGTTVPSKIVFALDGASRLAWRLNVAGVHRGHSTEQEIVVDARNGKILDRLDVVHSGTGTGHHNGPAPLSFRTSGSGSSYEMRDSQVPGLTCGQANGQTRSVPVLTGTDDVWGNGTTSIETGCVDALYSVQQTDGMLKNWLGRNSFKGDGTSWPVHVGLNDQNAFYCNGQIDCSGRNEVQFGKNPSGYWVSSLDVAGHEMGHGVDDYTPSGISRRGTQEFVGDVIGTLTEFYDNQPSGYDTPDYLIGEEADLVGSGEIRNMANPGSEGMPSCYTTSVDTMQVHSASGPGDHWFWLLANGGTSRCDGTAVSGIGVQTAGKIFYNAMLMKTTASGYRTYRTWTLQAAKNLYPGSCTEFNAVKLAWDAVNVPAQTADPTCSSSGSVSVTNPGNRTGTVGTAITSFTMSASGGTTPYTWSATGLPAGVSIGSSSGTVSGTPTAAGTYSVTVTATAASGGSGSTSFTFTVNPSGGGGCSGQKLANPGFESGNTGWSASSGVITTSTGRPARTGSWKAWLDGYGSSHTDTLSQSVTIPAGCSATLSFYLRIDTAETTSSVAYDKLTVKIGSSTLATYSNLNATGSYALRSFNVSSFAGQTVTVSFTGVEDSSLQTSFVIDDTSLTVS